MRLTPVLVLIVLTLALPITAMAQSATPAASPVPASGDFAGLVDIGGGRRLWLECRGHGSPTVILEAGYPNTADVWDTIALESDAGEMAVLPGVAAFTRVCAYDRPGTALDADHRSRSDPVPMPRTAADAVADLHALIDGAGIPGPYVLVGHSLGGIIVRLYAATYPNEVAGLVLVDASHEEQNVRYQAALTAEQWAAFERLQQDLSGLEDDPELERMDFDASFAELQTAAAAHPLPPLPLVVLTRGVPARDDLPPEVQAALPPDFPWETFDAVWQALQDELAALVPGARHVIATTSGHYIQVDQPELVIEAIRQVVEGVRHPDTWDDLASCCATNPTSGQCRLRPSTGGGSERNPGRLRRGREVDRHRRLGNERSVARARERRGRPPGIRPAGDQRVHRAGHHDLDCGPASDGESLQQLDGDALVTATQPLIGRTPTAAIPASGTVAVVMDVTVPPDRAVERLDHRITYEVAPDAPVRSLIGSFVIDGPHLPVDPRPTTILAPPLRGDGWLANSGCCAAASIHRGVRVPVGGARIGKPETFAIDFARLRDGQPFAGDGARPEDWYGFGAEVLAVADGTVVAIHEGYPEQIPQQPVTHVTTPEDFGGNAISLEIAPGVYAYYGHLQPGSITVAVGDQVTTGQVLGLLGNTGNSSGPHLHFGLIDDPDPLVGESLPMAFDHWTLQGTFDLDAYDAADGGCPSGADPLG